MKIGNVEIQNQFVLAPLAGISWTAFRMLCKENGAGLVYTQMIDAELIGKKPRVDVQRFLNIQDMERPVTVQLVGSNEAILVTAIRAVEEFADIIDLNVGCFEEDFCAKGAGSMLLRDLPKLGSLLKAMVNATEKTRDRKDQDRLG